MDSLILPSSKLNGSITAAVFNHILESWCVVRFTVTRGGDNAELSLRCCMSKRCSEEGGKEGEGEEGC